MALGDTKRAEPWRSSYDGSLGMMRPPSLPEGLPQWECPRMYFSAHFLSEPPAGATVVLPEGQGYPARGKEDGWEWPKGTKITLDTNPVHQKVIWVLDGTMFPLTTTSVYLGRWPD